MSAAVLALRDLLPQRRRHALPRWARRNAHLIANGPCDFPWSHEVLQAEARNWTEAALD